MFIEINDISTGTPVQEPLNAYSINYVYSKQEGSKYNLIYVLTNGIRKIEEFNNQSDLNDRIDEIKELSGGGGTNVYTYKGSCTFENLPTSDQVVGDVWNITNDFTLDGKPYPAGTNVAWDGTGWDALAGSFTVPVISNAEIDNLFLADLEFGYASTALWGEYNLRITTENLVFPAANFYNPDPHRCSNAAFHGMLSYGDLTADVTCDLILINEPDKTITFSPNAAINAVFQANGGKQVGVTFAFDIPANLFTVNGVGTKARHIEFVFGDPIDGHQYPSS